MAKRLKVTAARVTQIKREVAGKIRQSWAMMLWWMLLSLGLS